MKIPKTINWLGFAAAFMMLFGSLITLTGYQENQFIQRLQSAPIKTTSQIPSAQENADFLISGILTGETASAGHRFLDASAANMKLVIYQIQEWVECVESDQDGGMHTYGCWRARQYISPDHVSIDNIPIQIMFYRYEWLYTGFYGEYFESEVLVEGAEDSLDGTRIGSIRLVGYSDGDRVTIFGKVLPDQVFSIEKIFLGEADEFIDILVGGGWSRIGYPFFGPSMLILGAIGILIYFGFKVRGNRKKAKKSAKGMG